MNVIRHVAWAAGISLLISAPSFGATLGSAVTGNGSHVGVGGQPSASASETAALLGIAPAGAGAANVVGYFIPLTSGGSCTFGAGCGTSSDSGVGGTQMSMWLKFSNVEGGASTLNLYFEDLDLIGANDPVGFYEDVEVFGTAGGSKGMFDSITDANVSGSASTQQIISVDLGNLTAGQDYWTRLVFTADASMEYFANRYGADKAKYKMWKCTEYGKYCPWNTPEFLIASIEGTPAEVPLPASGALLLGGLGAFAAARRRKRS